jgi:hypothetical protein
MLSALQFLCANSAFLQLVSTPEGAQQAKEYVAKVQGADKLNSQGGQMERVGRGDEEGLESLVHSWMSMQTLKMRAPASLPADANGTGGTGGSGSPSSARRRASSAGDPTCIKHKKPHLIHRIFGRRPHTHPLLGHEGIDVNQATTDDGSTPLLMASCKGHAAVVEALLGQEGIDVNQATTDDGSTPLLMASQNGHVAVMEALLAKGASATAPITNNVTPLMVAAHFGHRGCVELLLLAVDAADVGVRMTGWNKFFKAGEGTTALQLAMTAGHLAIAELIEGG